MSTIAHCHFKYKGKDYFISYDFGEGYPYSSAKFMYEEGNYACDCNRSIIIRRDGYPDFPDLDCGEEIEMVELRIEGASEEEEW